ncbi:1-acyl-sn-glycerol-3-phosphate acyltransferase [Candidatus Sneabacter namystus]|uniref:1-acyl-sn-glycerol-3-phosphate acyltransferase n=1 Tax=Candidatus Sneabacter namystus TaxID=2601646 RepID=A0A5C0UI55_9RICK|nr:1-acyl-sn-glycerol-3-phosphate acyltransferase [Candidatus Sneabacter namystus]
MASAKWICGLNYSVYGLEKLPKVPSVVLSNHQSFWENLFMQVIIPKHSWVIKKELFKIPFFGFSLKMLDPIAIDRKTSSSVKSILEGGLKKIQQGLWLVIFPEAGRISPYRTVKIKPSGVKVALSAKVPIVIMVHNAGLYWPPGISIKRPGTIEVRIVDVIYPEQTQGLDVRTVTDRIFESMSYHKNLLVEKQESSKKFC